MIQIKPEAKVIAEIGAVHLGSMERAKNLISLAKLCGADFAKFQKRNPEECVPEELKNKPHPNQIFAYGETYLEHRKNLELSIEQHAELFSYCKNVGINYTASVWDLTSAKEITELNPVILKIPSPCNHNTKLLDFVYANYMGEIHISTGMISHAERENLISYIIENGDSDRTVIYHCTSIYPCPFEKLYLNDIEKLKKSWYKAKVGFSNHGFGIAADIAAWILGAEYIERHFVDDRTIRHTDAAASLEPEGLRKLCRDLKNVRRALEFSPEHPDELEIIERKKLRVNR